MIEFPSFINENNYDDIVWVKVDWNIFISFSTSLYAYACHTNLPQVQLELKDNTLKRSNKVGDRSIWSIFTLYILLAVFGYLSLLDDTPDIIANRRPPNAISND